MFCRSQMIAINSPEHSAVYLVHNELINKLYSDHKGSCQYKLHPQLFDFKPKIQTYKQEEMNNCLKRKKRKASNISPEIMELKRNSEFFLTKLKKLTEDFIYFQREYEEDIPRLWEEASTFPKFHGANARNDFQKFVFGDQEYLIPPKCRFYNYDILELHAISKSLDKYDLIVIDPPWKNKYIRRIKKSKQELGYAMINNDLLSDIPINSLIHCDSIVAVWCTNSKQHQQKLLEEFFPRWNLKLIQKIVWLKLNTVGVLIGEINEEGNKQPFEALFIACHNESRKDFSEIAKIKFILSVPSIIHSHKPPITDLFRAFLPDNPNCLELFARYLQPGFTSIGLEVLKLMNIRLYLQNNEVINCH